MRHRKAAAAIVAGEPTVLPRRRGERLRTRRRRAASGAVPARPRHPAGRPGCRALDRKPARCSARSTGRPRKEHQPGQGAGQGPKSQGAQAGPSYADGASRRPAHVDRPAAAHVGKQGSVCGAGYRFARRRTRPHTVVVHRCRREVLPAEQRPGADPDAAAAQGSAGTRRTRGCVGAGAGRGGSSPGHDPDEGYRPPGSGSGRQLGGGRYTQAG
ncbi:proline-rich membrane protein [Mycobacterium tuberculosis variant bovis BCG]|nr:proline-rich membrane protein [Mycobacterium tuberculosis variant bovis BCG]